MLPELQSVALRVVEPDELALSLGIRPDAYGRRLHPRFVKGGDDCVDIIDPVVHDVTSAGLTWIPWHDRVHEVLRLLRAIGLAVIQLDVIGVLVRDVAKLPP